jgi:hypothetical protein
VRVLGDGGGEHGGDARVHRIAAGMVGSHTGIGGVIAAGRNGAVSSAGCEAGRLFAAPLGLREDRIGEQRDREKNEQQKEFALHVYLSVTGFILKSMSEISELLERFRRGPEVLAVALTGSAGAESDFVPAPGKWTIRQVLRHLADSEIVGAHRFRKILAEDNPPIDAYDQNLWASNLDYETRKPAESLEMFRRLRADTYDLLKGLPETAFERTGVHAERGTVTVKAFVDSYSGHTESHAGQIQQIREEFKKTKAIKK